MFTFELSHFSAAILFAICASVVFGICLRSNVREMVRYGAYCFAMFVLGVFAASWLMWLIKH